MERRSGHQPGAAQIPDLGFDIALLVVAIRVAEGDGEATGRREVRAPRRETDGPRPCPAHGRGVVQHEPRGDAPSRSNPREPRQQTLGGFSLDQLPGPRLAVGNTHGTDTCKSVGRRSRGAEIPRTRARVPVAGTGVRRRFTVPRHERVPAD